MRTLLGGFIALLAVIGIGPAMAAPPAPSFTILDATAVGKSLCFPVKKHGKLNNLSSTVTFYVIAGTAKAGVDYVDPGRVTVTFASSTTLKNQCITVTPGATVKTLTGKLIAGTNARLYDGTATGTIPAAVIVTPPPPVDPPPPADGWIAFSMTDPYRGLNRAFYARALSACAPVYPEWGPALVSGRVYRLWGMGKRGDLTHWSVIPETDVAVTATNSSTVDTSCLVGVYKSTIPPYPWTAP